MRRLLVTLGSIVLLSSCSTKHTETAASESTAFIRNDITDSTQLQRLVKAAELKYAGLSEDSLDTVNWDVVDSLLSDGGTTCCDGNIFYSPDSLFKIYVIKGESCGGYCNVFWESCAYSADNSKLSGSHEFSFTDILNIVKMPDDKYLIIQREGGRAASAIFVDCRTAALVSLRNDSLIFHPVLKNIADENLVKDFYNEITGLSFCQEHYVPSNEPSIQYHAATKELVYNIGKNYAYCCQVETDSSINGTLKYEDGAFKFLKHSTKFLAPALEE